MGAGAGERDPLSRTITSFGGRVCEVIESRQARSMSPPSISRTITETSLMLHPVEVGASVQTAQLRAPSGAGVDARVDHGVSVDRTTRRQDEGMPADLDRGPAARLVAERGRSGPGQEGERV